MLSVSVEEMEKDIAAYLRLVRSGETLVITQENQPVAEMKAISTAPAAPRPFALCAGFSVPADFDAPLPPEILDAFEGQ